MKKLDKEALYVYERLKKIYDEISKKSGYHSNIAGIFMHELMSYFTNFLILREEKSKRNYKLEFPYLNNDYVLKPYNIFFDKYNFKYKLNFKIFALTVNFLSSIIANFSKKQFIYLDSHFPSEIRPIPLITKLLKKGIPTFFILNPKLDLINGDEQIRILEKGIRDIASDLNFSNYEIFSSNFIRFCLAFFNNKKQTILKKGIFYSGGISSLSSRIIASNVKKNSSLVLVSHHGESNNLTIDDPYQGYGEFSYCDYIITYGADNIKFGNYNSPLKGHDKFKTFFCNSKLISKIYKGNKNIKKVNINRNTKILYVPTSFEGNQRYGPFRDIDDDLYLYWQRTLLGFLNNIATVTYKSHPVNKSNIKIFGSINVDSKNLKAVFDKYDFFILDYYSTAFSILCATEKPIIFLDLNTINVNDDVLEVIKGRCFYEKINLEINIVSQIEKVFSKYQKSSKDYVNHFSSKYCLSKNRIFQEEALINLINKKSKTQNLYK